MILVYITIVLLLWANVAAVVSFRRRRASGRWWTAMWFAWILGGAIGVYGGFFFEYQPTETLRVFGAPVPAVFLHLEGPPDNQQWVDYITPAPLLFAGSNIIILAMAAGCLVATGFVLCSRARRDCVVRNPDEK
jgi:hypothetical protein